MEWYYSDGGQQAGPVSQGDFDHLVHTGVIKPDTLVWHQGMANWQPFASIAGDTPGISVDPDTAICAVSGKRYPKREMIQFEGQWISAEHRDTYFQRMREGVPQPGRFTFGNFWPRFAAWFLDWLVLTVCSVIVNMILGMFLLGSGNYFEARMQPANPTPYFVFQAVSMFTNIAIALGYAVFFIRRYNATPGKMALGLKLVRPDGSSLGVGRIIGRYFAMWISGMILMIGYIMAAFDDERRALHDRICDTRVVKSS